MPRLRAKPKEKRLSTPRPKRGRTMLLPKPEPRPEIVWGDEVVQTLTDKVSECFLELSHVFVRLDALDERLKILEAGPTQEVVTTGEGDGPIEIVIVDPEATET